MTTPSFICANWDPSKKKECKKTGTFSCTSCRLVIYCGPMCQKTHWPRHKIDCKSPVGKKTWEPDWIGENREPAFVEKGDTDRLTATQFGGSKYLWGNMPALDVLQLGRNEGEGYQGDLGVLFAASGDFRNVVKTLAMLPSGYNRNISIVINDRDLDIVARNLILLLVALVVEDTDEAVECMIHLWYSSLIRKSDLNILQHRIRPFVAAVCEKIMHRPSGKLLGKTWEFGTRTVRVIMQKSSWDTLLSFFDMPTGMTAERACEARNAVNHATSRIDYRHRFMCYLSPAHRIAFNRFREDGILLPFGTPRHEFQEPNPTLFQHVDTWPMRDDASPLIGWPTQEVARTSSGAATSDIYGKLYYYVRSTFQSLISSVSSRGVSFRLFQMDALALPDHLDGELFSRIDVSNISDAGFMGISRTLEFAIPLLQTPLENPHATLISLFMNAVFETMSTKDLGFDKAGPEIQRLQAYLFAEGPPRPGLSRVAVKYCGGLELVRDYEHIFERYTDTLGFLEAADHLGAKAKDEHTVTEKWPFHPKLKPGQPEAQEEFDQLLAGSPTGKERYVEWKRIY